VPIIDQASAETLLQRMLAPGATFREGQWEAIDLIANQRRRVLLVQRTGWGKSIIYFLATKVLREQGAGPTLLISPLLALMRNQIAAATKLGIRPFTIHSENLEEWGEAERALQANQCDVLLVSPERLGNADFLQKLLPMVQGNIGLFVVDEAHCISDWGHDFRPDYRRIVRILRLLPAGVPVLGTTATANNRVVQDVTAQIANLRVSRGPLIRHSLKLFNIDLPTQADRLAWLAHFVPQLPGNGIIYCLTIQDSRRVAAWLQQKNISARPYHSDLEASERIEAEQLLLDNQLKALVATVALGMGFDKPDLGFVIHFQRPGSVVAYYQQVGRAGRAVDTAFGILLSGREDDEIQDYFIRTAFPPLDVMNNVLDALKKGPGLTIDQICAELNYRRGAIEKALKLLEVDGAVERQKRLYSRTPNPWKADMFRAEAVTAQRRAELEQIKQYVAHQGCLMEFLARALDDPHARPCGKCMNCSGQTRRRLPPAELTSEAVQFLRGDELVLSPRIRWPQPVLEEVRSIWPTALDYSESGAPKTVLPEKLRSEEGRVLCLYGDAGWGDEVARGKYQTETFSDLLVEASARLVRERWRPEPPPEWVTFIPSLRHTTLVHNFARALALKLELPFYPALAKATDNRPQKEMQNSPTQLRNLFRAFLVHKPLNGPVLLIDDVVDSGWTMAVAALILRQHGSGPVFPFALAKASPRGS
jgi:ATP-dependent DNA helicase RecQ